MGIHDSARARFIAEETAAVDRLINELRQNPEDKREKQLYKDIQKARQRLKDAHALPEHSYWCDFCHKQFVSAARMTITLKAIYDHDKDGTAIKHWLDGKVLVMCGRCKKRIDPVEGATAEPD